MPLLSHGGAIPGYAADLYYVPHCDLGIVTLASADGAYFIDTVVSAILELCDLPEPTQPPDLTVDPAAFDNYVGDYDDPFNAGPVTLTRDGDDLRVAMPLLDQAGIPYDPVLLPTSPRTFSLGVHGTQLPLTVIVDAEGKGEYLRTRPFVAGRVAQRTSEAPVATRDVTKWARSLRTAPREPTLWWLARR